ncbi:hypothetical protein [Clostridium sp. CTA-6]|nr:hypothetical protein [Clostridium botulinum]EKS4395776.1 hypothetical protein [Clostridium botulinum]
MKIDYVKKVCTGCYSGYGYEIKNIELCCEWMKYDLTSNLINMSGWNPYERRDYYLGLVINKDNHKILINFCPHCGKPIILNKLEDEIYNELDRYDSEKIINRWDYFSPYDFNKNQRFYNCKYEK